MRGRNWCWFSPVECADPPERFRGFVGLHFKILFGPRWVVAAPNPAKFFGCFNLSAKPGVGAIAEGEMKIIALAFEGVRHLDILKRPAAVFVFKVFGAVLQPDPDVALRLFANFVGVGLAAVERVRLPLNAGEAADR